MYCLLCNICRGTYPCLVLRYDCLYYAIPILCGPTKRSERKLHTSLSKIFKKRFVDPEKCLQIFQIKKMGSKTPCSKIKKPNIACNVCDMRFQTLQTLRAHKMAKHTRETQPQIPKSASNVPKNTSSVVTSPRLSRNRLRLRKNGARDAEQSENSEDRSTQDKLDKIQFACTVCNKFFDMYFQTLKHIEKKHPEYSG